MNSDESSGLQAIREQIDQLDAQFVALIGERQTLVHRAGLLKSDDDAVRAPARVEQILVRVRKLADEAGASPDIVERVYRAVIESFIEYELSEHSAVRATGDH